MEGMIRSVAATGDHGQQEGGGGNASKMEGFNLRVEEISSKVTQLQQRVNQVEQFYAAHKQLNVKDKVKDKHLMGIDKLLQGQNMAAADKRMKEVMRQFAGIFRQASFNPSLMCFRFHENHDTSHDSGIQGCFYQVIKQPMDFTTIKNKMEARDDSGYKNVREIYADVRLVFKNAMKYNDEKNDVHVMAKTLLEKFEEKWLQLLPKVAEAEKSLVEEEAAAQVFAKLAQEASHAKMARNLSKELSEVDMHLEELRESVVQSCRKMSIEDKKKLIAALAQLTHEDLIRAIEIVAENNPAFEATAEEVDLDIDAQSESTLWRLKIFVQDTLGRKPMAFNGNKTTANGEKEDKMKDKDMTIATTTINHNRNSSKRRREICDALTKTSNKRTKKVSLSSLPR
ncbi:hypothetical protein Tsubulata_027485 [Turnera subulata]|uniref:Bromo domain-containing protein n=1 Tax=Turnera subulata TaxID=218843 RepID=A0A9Q0JGU4_9ROSI|nr:hypothetical protein Tsubulata_027485 [Turnera subulata]